MSFSKLLSPEVQRYLLEHEHADEVELLLKHKSILGLPTPVIAEQLLGRRKAKEKLPTLYKTPGIIYPHQKNLEQSSSEVTAEFKASLIKGDDVIDLTSGFSIDSYFFSRHFKTVSCVEPNPALLEIASHNCHKLGIQNMRFYNSTAEEYVKTMTPVDAVYIDPSRRDGSDKVVQLSECSPDITLLQKEILKKSSRLLVKTSPMLDVKLGIHQLEHVSDVWVVSVNNECKELLFLCDQTSITPVIHAVNILSNGTRQTYDFTFSSEHDAEPDFSSPKAYLYEPNASLLKGGAFRSVSNFFSIQKISANTHLYTSDRLLENFPGRIFKISSFIKPDAAAAFSALPQRKANVLTRNYPLTSDQLKKKLKLNDGGEDYIIAFSGPKEKYVVVAKRVTNFIEPG